MKIKLLVSGNSKSSVDVQTGADFCGNSIWSTLNHGTMFRGGYSEVQAWLKRSPGIAWQSLGSRDRAKDRV